MGLNAAKRANHVVRGENGGGREKFNRKVRECRKPHSSRRQSHGKPKQGEYHQHVAAPKALSSS